MLLADIRGGNDYDALNTMMKLSGTGHEPLLRRICEIIHEEVITYSKLPSNLLARSNAEELEKFTLQV